MLTTDTKHKIDSARDILVGKVPDPKAQVDQITNALIYKFMDDMDQESIELGGKPRYFTNGYEKYAWTKLMDPKHGGLERLDLYVEAISKLSQNPHLPQLFRDIFKDAFLPYRDPETLSLFLKQINEFTYHHSEELGNSFEYLLSILGSQGDAGQFRTPRHIIDFIVSVVDPKKTDRILDPACGTAGFLISAYKHILASHDGKDEGGEPNKETRLSPDERKRLVKSVVGYDISPDMVKLSRVNMYLHGFPEPHISEYDTLTSEDKWDDSFDVILANPPFMTPKGGVRPHKRFSVQANRAEVLFVDYIAEHLTNNGRGGVIVPEGIIFKADTAHKSLRKMLIDNGLWCVVSLPAGVFNPYAGVKTSILFIDKDLAKKFNHVMFININSDGFDLGANRRPITHNDLPNALVLINECKKQINSGDVRPDKYFPFDDPKHIISVAPLSYSFEKVDRIRQEPDSTFQSSRYASVEDTQNQKWPMVELGEILDYEQPTKYIVESVDYKDSYKTPVLTAGKSFILGYTNEESGIFKEKLPVIIFDDFTTATKFVNFRFKVKSSAMKILHPKTQNIDIGYVFRAMQNVKFKPTEHKRYWISQYSKLKIPLPPIDVQKNIVAELDGYQKIIDATQVIINGYKPTITIDPSWEVVPLNQLADLLNGVAFRSADYIEKSNTLNFRMSNIRPDASVDINYNPKYLPDSYYEKYKDYALYDGDVVIAMTDMAGDPKILGVPTIVRTEGKKLLLNQRVGKFKDIDTDRLYIPYLKYLLQRDEVKQYYKSLGAGGVQINIGKNQILSILIPLPPLDKQRAIVKKIEEEQVAIQANKTLGELFKQKITDRITEVWG